MCMWKASGSKSAKTLSFRWKEFWANTLWSSDDCLHWEQKEKDVRNRGKAILKTGRESVPLFARKRQAKIWSCDQLSFFSLLCCKLHLMAESEIKNQSCIRPSDSHFSHPETSSLPGIIASQPQVIYAAVHVIQHLTYFLSSPSPACEGTSGQFGAGALLSNEMECWLDLQKWKGERERENRGQQQEQAKEREVGILEGKNKDMWEEVGHAKEHFCKTNPPETRIPVICCVLVEVRIRGWNNQQQFLRGRREEDKKSSEMHAWESVVAVVFVWKTGSWFCSNRKKEQQPPEKRESAAYGICFFTLSSLPNNMR